MYITSLPLDWHNEHEYIVFVKNANKKIYVKGVININDECGFNIVRTIVGTPTFVSVSITQHHQLQ